MSGITCRPKFKVKIDEINNLLKTNAGICNSTYIDNTNIRKQHLWTDDLHLNREGTRVLANNYLAHLNRPALLPFDKIWD